MKLMMIDGNSIINRAFYGVRMLNAPDGTPTNAVYGFLNIYRKLLNEENPDAVCVAFDLKAPTFRHEMYDDYKAQRKGMPEELAVQMPIIKEVLDALGVRRCECAGWEADDIIGTAAKMAGQNGDTCVIVTGDKDSFQLIDGATSVRHVKTRMGQTETKLYDEAAFREEYGFDPPYMVDLKALMGDASDNIPGVPGVGEKTAMGLIQSFGTVEKIYRDLDSLDIKDSVKKKLTEGKDFAEMSYTLATISREAPIDFTADDAAAGEPDKVRLREIFERLGFKKLIETYGLQSVESPAPKAEFSGVVESFRVEDGETLEKMKAALSGGICGVAFSVDDNNCYVDQDGRGFIINGESPLYREAMEALLSPAVKKAGYGLKDAVRRLSDNGFSSGGWEFDGEIAAYLLDPLKSGYDIYDVTERYCGFRIAGEGDQTEQLSFLSDSAENTGKKLSEAAAGLCLYETLSPLLEEKGLGRVF